MTLNTAIKRAIESGYGKQYPSYWDLTDSDTMPKEKILMDAQFWQCLGVAMGWKIGYYEFGSANDAIEMSPYKVQWHRFIDALASGKTADEAMGEILR